MISHISSVRLDGKYGPLTAPELSHWHTPRDHSGAFATHLSSDHTPLTVSHPAGFSSVAPGDPGYRADQRDERADREPAESR